MKRRLKKPVVYSLYGISFLFIVAGITLLRSSINKGPEINYKYVSKSIFDYEQRVPVVNNNDKIAKPFNDVDITVVKSYYDFKAEADSQEKSLIYYEGTYMPSSGVAYSNGKSFDVVAVLDGKVIEVKEDTILGNVITIEHTNGVMSVYQSVSDINVKVDDSVIKGQVIAKSSVSDISKELDNHLYFELIIDGICVNPENYYNKSVNEL